MKQVCVNRVADGGDHPRRGVADAGHRDPGGEVDPFPAVDVDDRAAACVVHIGRNHGADAPGHRGHAALVQFF
jgi:hypothetical protein